MLGFYLDARVKPEDDVDWEKCLATWVFVSIGVMQRTQDAITAKPEDDMWSKDLMVIGRSFDSFYSLRMTSLVVLLLVDVPFLRPDLVH